MNRTRDIVVAALAAGESQAVVARRLGLSKGAIAYHARRIRPPDPKFSRRYDWAAVQVFYDQGNSVSACQRQFGFARKTFFDAWKAGKVRTRGPAMPIEQLLVVGRRTNRHHLRGRLQAAGLKPARCELCDLDRWRGRPLALQLHHMNGNGLDNRLENLQVLCPNCHSQTDTWGGRNRPQRSAASGAPHASSDAGGGTL